MQYTNYFSQQIGINGPIHLGGENQRVMMNIVAIEARCAAFIQANQDLKGTGQENRFTKDIFTSRNTLEQLTGGVEPQVLMRKMI